MRESQGGNLIGKALVEDNLKNILTSFFLNGVSGSDQKKRKYPNLGEKKASALLPRKKSRCLFADEKKK